tara:strand:- start:114 stop:587 length:474 start_codon:yes stop_codon:yes gene_type:complete
MHPKSLGSVSLADSNPKSSPIIDPNFLSDERDLDALIAGVKVTRRILASHAFDAVRGPELRPGKDIVTNDEIKQYVRDNCATVYHPVRTCAMGPDDDPMAVVDTQLRVNGVRGLRVIDASVMPLQIGGNTNAPTIMIAEKAADMLLGKPAAPAFRES